MSWRASRARRSSPTCFSPSSSTASSASSGADRKRGAALRGRSPIRARRSSGLARETRFSRRSSPASRRSGGRFSALSPFGLVPAAFLGIDLARSSSGRPARRALPRETVTDRTRGSARAGARGRRRERARQADAARSRRASRRSAAGSSSWSPNRPASSARMILPIDGSSSRYPLARPIGLRRRLRPARGPSQRGR